MCTDNIMICKEMGFFSFQNEIWRFLTVSKPLMTSRVSISEPPCDEYSNAATSHGTSLTEKKENNHKKIEGLMTTNKCPLRTKSAKESRPWGVTAWGAGASYKLHGGGMIMCKETKEKTNSWILQYVGDRRINTLCWISKGISLFSVLSLLFFPRLLKTILDGWNVSEIHSTLQMGRLESRSDDYCLAHPGFFFCPFLCVFFLF